MVFKSKWTSREVQPAASFVTWDLFIWIRVSGFLDHLRCGEDPALSSAGRGILCGQQGAAFGAVFLLIFHGETIEARWSHILEPCCHARHVKQVHSKHKLYARLSSFSGYWLAISTPPNPCLGIGTPSFGWKFPVLVLRPTLVLECFRWVGASVTQKPIEAGISNVVHIIEFSIVFP